MKSGFILSVISLTITVSCSVSRPEDGNHKVELYATNDIHGRFFDSLYTDTTIYPYSVASVAGYMKNARMRAGEESVVLLDIGDNLQGDNSVFYYNYVDTSSEHIFSKIVKYLKYDAVTVGNHDIEAGHKVYDKLKNKYNVPYIAANAVSMKKGKPYFEPYKILYRNGFKIAVIGMTNPNIKKWLSQDLWVGMNFEEIIPSLQYWVDKVKEKENPDLIVAALHIGLGDYDTYEMESPARYVAKNVKGIDILFAAHDHKTDSENIFNGTDSVLLMEGGSKASSLSFADVEFGIKDGKIVSKKIKGENIPMKGVSPNKDYLNYFSDDYAKVKTFTNQIAGTLKNRISSADSFFGPSEYIDMIHSLQLKNSGADISFAAPLSFNVTIEPGELNYQDLLNIYPFENQLYVIELTGLEIKNYLEYSYSKWINKMGGPEDHLIKLSTDNKNERSKFLNMYFNFDSAAGIIYEVDVRKGDGERIIIKSLSNGQPFFMDKKYSVALSSYRANGGGDLLELGSKITKEELDKRVLKRLTDIREILFNQLKRDGSIEAVRLNTWKFVPEDFVKEAAKRDFNLLFSK